MIVVHKAQPVGDTPLPDLRIEATEVISSDWANRSSVAENMALFQREARAIADALYASLPGGTLDQLLREMLERKASQFVVPHPKIDEQRQRRCTTMLDEIRSGG